MDLFAQFSDLTWWQWIICWLVRDYIELAATLTGIIYLVYSIKGDRRLWFYGLITSALYVYVFYISGIYADMGINAYYVIISIYGWIHWTFYQQKEKHQLPYSAADKKQWLFIFLAIAILFLAIGLILDKATDSNIPYWDAFTTSSGIVATWMLARKIIDHWLIWIVVDFISVGLYFYKGLYPTVFLFVLNTVLAVTGYIQWRRAWKLQQSQ